MRPTLLFDASLENEPTFAVQHRLFPLSPRAFISASYRSSAAGASVRGSQSSEEERATLRMKRLQATVEPPFRKKAKSKGNDPELIRQVIRSSSSSTGTIITYREGSA